jgi:N6-adenosine-specific RNA methylase IME4
VNGLPCLGSTKKPEELYHIIEHFAQGMRRIELFGEDHNIRAGWVTVGKGLTSSNFNPQVRILKSCLICSSSNEVSIC